MGESGQEFPGLNDGCGLCSTQQKEGKGQRKQTKNNSKGVYL